MSRWHFLHVIVEQRGGIKMTNIERAMFLMGAHRLPNTRKLKHDAADFRWYISDIGVRHFHPDELLIPEHPRHSRQKQIEKIMARLGYKYLLPKPFMWPRLACVLLFADVLRGIAEKPIRIKYAWRPHDFNEAIAGARQSDHIEGNALDLVFVSKQNLAKVKHIFLDPLYTSHAGDFLQLSIGEYGTRTLHVGLFSSKGKRRWNNG
jgi:hypothetical protein